MAETQQPPACTEAQAWAEVDNWRFVGANSRSFSWRQRLVIALASAGFRAYERVIGDGMHWNLHDPFGIDDTMRRGQGSFIFSIWHNRLIGAISFFERFHTRVRHSFRIASLVSESFDGELIARSIRDVNGENVRGSSSHNAVAGLKQAVEELKRGMNLCVTADGPKGPRYELKPGAIMASKLSQRPIVPFVFSCSRAMQFRKSWDQLLIPLRKARMDLYLGEPLTVPQDAKPREIATARREVERRMQRLTELADRDTRIIWQMPAPRPNEQVKLRKSPQVALDKRL